MTFPITKTNGSDLVPSARTFESDADAELFLDHYDTVQGTFQTFALGNVGADRRSPTRGGWEGNKDALGAQTHGNNYRYEGPPQVAQVASGRSTVTVNLIGVL